MGGKQILVEDPSGNVVELFDPIADLRRVPARFRRLPPDTSLDVRCT
jgi:hypothetical protein